MRAGGRNTGRWRGGALAGALALLFQVVAWAWLPMPAMGMGTLVICSPEGLKVVTLGPDGQAISAQAISGQALPDQDGPVKAGKADPDQLKGRTNSGTASYAPGCPLCALVAGLTTPPPLDLGLPTVMVRHDPVALPGERIAAGWFLSTLQARAPPTSA